MRKISFIIIGIFCILCEFNLHRMMMIHAKEYEPCVLMTELINDFNLTLQDSLGMTCVANEVSELKTTHAQTEQTEETDYRVFGMFGIREGKACKFTENGICGVTCDKFLDNEISDDLQCMKILLKNPKTGQRNKVYQECQDYKWKQLMEDCKNDVKKLLKRQISARSEFFNLVDFEIYQDEDGAENEEVEERTKKPKSKPTKTKTTKDSNFLINLDTKTEERNLDDEQVFLSDESPKPFTTKKKTSSKKPKQNELSEDTTNVNFSDREPNYVTDQPPMPFSKPKKPKKSSRKRNNNKNRKVTPRLSPESSESDNSNDRPIQINITQKPKVIMLPHSDMVFRVIPGPSVSVPISSITIPDVPIEPPPVIGPSRSFAGPKYLPPEFTSQSEAFDGKSKSYDIKLDRPVSQITLHVKYA